MECVTLGEAVNRDEEDQKQQEHTKSSAQHRKIPFGLEGKNRQTNANDGGDTDCR